VKGWEAELAVLPEGRLPKARLSRRFLERGMTLDFDIAANLTNMVI
jgi:hypothetical protein